MKPTILIATRNAHKVQEIQSILGERFTFLNLRDFPGAPDVVEDAPDFAGNAGKKAVELAQWIGETYAARKPDYVLADDSGLEVDALNGAPGVHSARFAALDTGAKGNSSDAENNAKLLRLLAGVPAERRTGRFRCVMAFLPTALEAALRPALFDGACPGRMLDAPRGAHGFGYDPLFVPEGFSDTFAELGEETKNRISHRSKALEKLKARLDAEG